MITCRSRNEALQQEIKNLESIVQEARKKLASYELALEKVRFLSIFVRFFRIRVFWLFFEKYLHLMIFFYSNTTLINKAAIKYTNLQVSNENLEKDVNKLKSLNHTIDTCGSSSNTANVVTN
jgi:hypothetical protein